MSCILRIIGANLDIDYFITNSGLNPYKKSYKGQPKLTTKPEGEKLSFSGLSIETSASDFDDLKKQIEDTITYLEQNQAKLKFINSTKEIEYAILDFGVDLRIDGEKNLFKFEKFPSKLLKLAGDLGLDIELSIYPSDIDI